MSVSHDERCGCTSKLMSLAECQFGEAGAKSAIVRYDVEII